MCECCLVCYSYGNFHCTLICSDHILKVFWNPLVHLKKIVFQVLCKMSNAHEVITIQVGQYANFIGTHWWNMQEASFCYSKIEEMTLDINHDVLFREGLNPQREVTFTPRLIAIDKKESLKSLKKEGALYSVSEEKVNLLWDEGVEILKKDPEKKNLFLQELESEETNKKTVETGKLYNLDSTVHVWSDFLKTSLHPRSLCLIDEHAANFDDSNLAIYGQGVMAYNNEINQNMIEDTVRLYVEECNYLQGFNVLVDGYNGFSGIGSRILQHLDDEYQRKPSLCIPVFQNSNRILSLEKEKERIFRLYSALLCFNDFNDYSSLFSPLSLCNDILSFDGPHQKFPYLDYKPNLQYHTSAILATALETITTAYRLKCERFVMTDIAQATVPLGRKMVSTNVCLPFPLKEGTNFSTLIEKETSHYAMSSLSPFCQNLKQNILAQLAVLRGFPNRCYNTPQSSYQNMSHKYDVFSQYLMKWFPSLPLAVAIGDQKCSTINPFPNIFTKEVCPSGLLGVEERYQNKGVTSVPVAASLINTNKAGEFIENLLDLAEKRNFKRFVKRASESNLEQDNFDEAFQNLKALQESYLSDLL